ncbi:MAG: hypothetical protein CMK27_03135 [Porticoccaceae bacterium]|nr:hypothetical protein [Porticoccaceae bacterium]
MNRTNQFVKHMTVALILMCTAITSSESKEISVKNCLIENCLSRPIVDGVINEDEWREATRINRFVQVKPNEASNPSEKTTVLLLITNSTFYIAAKLYDKSPSDIIAKVSRQGASISNDDFFRVQIDPFNSKRAGYRFQVNMNSVRNEGIFLNITSINDDWTSIWEAKATQTSYGWSTEIAIPFKSLSFDPETDVWGFNVFRYISRKNELISWITRNQESNISVSGSLSGFKGIQKGLGLDVVPNLSFQSSSNDETGVSEDMFQPSLDVFYKITPSLNGSLTFNTDFSATEVDDRRVDLSQFSLFFPEKRAFFLREFDIFDFGGIGSDFSYSRFGGSQSQNARPFFSRKIGLGTDGSPVDIIGGAKVSGRLKGYDLGVLIVEQDSYQDVKQKSLFVGRISKNINSNTTLGLIHTRGDPRSNNRNSVTGMDLRYRNSSTTEDVIEGNIWYQSSTNDYAMSDEDAFGISLSKPSPRGFRGLLQYQNVGKNFNPALGFVSRRNVELYRGIFGYVKQFDDHPYIRKIYSGADTAYWDLKGMNKLQSYTQFYRLLDVEYHSGDKFNISYVRFGEGIYSENNQPFSNLDIVLPEREYHWDRYGIYFRSSKSRSIDFKLNYYTGDYYTGTRDSGSIDLGYRPRPGLDFSIDYNYWDVDLPEGSFILRQLDAKFSWNFFEYLSWVNVIQYDNISKSLGFNSRLHWTKKAGENLYLVFTNNYSEIDEANSRDFELISRDASIKVNYTIRF